MHEMCVCSVLSACAVVLVGFAAASACGLEVLVAIAVAACVAFVTTWRAMLPRKVWEDPSIVGVNRLATHSRLGNYLTFQDAAARGQSSNVISLRYIFNAYNQIQVIRG